MNNIISKADYQGHNILGSFKEDITPLQIITDNFNKGLIDEQTFESAKEQLENLLTKGGEGSRGGEVLGHTSSGSPIYKRHQDYADQALEKLKSGENHQTLVDYQGHKQIEHIQPNKGKDKGSYSRYMMAPNKDKSTAIKHNAYLEDHEVHRHLTHAAADREEKSNLKKSNSDYDLTKGGEGSKGGKVIGHTKSGKPIYENRTAGHDSYKDFSKQDHKDAADAHYSHYHKKDADGSTVLHGKKSFESHLDQSNKKVFMNNLDWGKTTEERNNNLDKFDSLKTDQEKEDFKISLKFPKK